MRRTRPRICLTLLALGVLVWSAPAVATEIATFAEISPVDPADEPTPFDVPGAILRAEIDPEAWLSAGYGGELPVLVDSRRIYLAPAGPPDSAKRVVARYAAADALRLSGFMWPESAERLPGAVFAYEERIGDGRVILMAEDPNFRAYWRGANRLFLNAVVLSPSAP